MSSRPTSAAHTDINDSHCLQRNDKDVKAALFRMHESESWGQVQQSMTGGGRRKEKDGGGVRGGGGAEREERSEANGFMVTVIIRLLEITSSHTELQGRC